MEAVILAGGKGTRLRPYTTTLPKPLVPVGDRPILEILLIQLRKAGVKKVTIAVNHLAELIMAFFGDGSKWGLEIVYSLESQPLGTVAPLKLLNNLPNNFFVMNGDILTDIDFADLFRNHEKNKSLLTVSTYHRTTKIDFGVIETENNYISGFKEKPEYHFNVSMGIYVFSKEVLKVVPENQPFGFDQLVLTMLDKKMPILTYPFDGYWLDIGRPDDYATANNDIDKLNFT